MSHDLVRPPRPRGDRLVTTLGLVGLLAIAGACAGQAAGVDPRASQVDNCAGCAVSAADGAARFPALKPCDCDAEMHGVDTPAAPGCGQCGGEADGVGKMKTRGVLGPHGPGGGPDEAAAQ